jgi:hypothetical protein
MPAATSSHGAAGGVASQLAVALCVQGGLARLTSRIKSRNRQVVGQFDS